MQFVFLTHPEVEGAAIRWDDSAVKSAELVRAALAAEFSEGEIHKSPLGIVEQDFPGWPVPNTPARGAYPHRHERLHACRGFIALV